MLNCLKFLLGPALLIGTAPFLFWLQFPGVFPFYEACRASLLLVVMLVLLMLLSARFVWGKRNSALLGTAIATGFVFYFSRNLFLSLILIAVFLLITLIERRVSARKTSIIAITLGGAMLFLALFQISPLLYGERNVLPTKSEPLQTATLKNTPSIIHIVLDGYGANDVLRDIYQHDNQVFLDTLEQRGFVVMPRVFTPFNQTLFAMASIMSGGYVEPPSAEDDGLRFRFDLGHTIQNSWVQNTLRAAGYNFAYTKNDYAILNLENATQVTPSHLGLTWMEAEMLSFEPQFAINAHNRNITAALRPENFTALETPYFYYQHMIAPHPPFTLTADGKARAVSRTMLADGSHFGTQNLAIRQLYIDGYREKATFIESALLKQLASIPENEPIIVIIHGDHGPGSHFDHDSYDNTCIRERMTTFLAVYSNIPDVQNEFALQASSEFNLTNIYRIVFSALSEAEIPSLPNLNTFINWYAPSEKTEIPSSQFDVECD